MQTYIENSNKNYIWTYDQGQQLGWKEWAPNWNTVYTISNTFLHWIQNCVMWFHLFSNIHCLVKGNYTMEHTGTLTPLAKHWLPCLRLVSRLYFAYHCHFVLWCPLLVPEVLVTAGLSL